MNAVVKDILAGSPAVPEAAVLDPSLERVHRRMLLRLQRRAAWLRKLWDEEGRPGGKQAVTHAEIDTLLNGCDRPEAEAKWAMTEESVQAWNQELERIEDHIQADRDSPLAQLRRIFGLSDREFDLFQACLALALDPSLGRACAYLQDHAGRGYVTEDLAARLFGFCGEGFWNPTSPLKRWELIWESEVGPGEPMLLACDPCIRNWLLGAHSLDPLLVGVAELYAPQEPLNDWPVGETAEFLQTTLTCNEHGGARVSIVGIPGTGRRTLAAVISARMGLPLLAIDTDRIDESAWARTFVRAQRQAYLERSALAWQGERVRQRPWPKTVSPFPVQFIIAEKDDELAPVKGLIDHRIEMPTPTLDELRGLWRKFVPASISWSREQINSLVERHHLTVAQISAMGRHGLSSYGQAVEFARENNRHRLGKLAQWLECTFKWDDLIVTDRLKIGLTDLLYEAKNRAAFWERPAARRLYPQGRGLIALFAGPPGTGKTMAAQVIAGSLGLDLFRIDLSTVVSKYVGETSQNLEQILSRAKAMDAVLLFDEADALFGKRTEIRDAHDRFANTDTGYLLQAIESYQGIALLTTNKKGNIDPGFIRRLRYVFEFSKPDADQRRRIWERVIAELAGVEVFTGLAADLGRLGASLEITGAQIKFGVLAAFFAAQQNGEELSVRHLLRGLDHEFAKEGRALSDRERERLQGHG